MVRNGLLAILLVLCSAVPLAAGSGRSERADGRPVTSIGPGLPIGGAQGPALRYRVTATNPRLIRRVMGPVRRTVDGVTAEPVDSMCWNGVGATPIEGGMILDVEPMSNTGYLTAKWTDHHGNWTARQTIFYHPDHHPSGLRVGPSANQTQSVINEGISHNVYLHGDTGSGMPVLPTVFAYLATWGPMEVTRNGVIFANPYEIPAPLWHGHTMVTEGVRRPDGTVHTLSGEIFSPAAADFGAVEEGDIEAHLSFHDEMFPNTGNMPEPFSFLYHLEFEDVRIEIVQADSAAAEPEGF